MPSNRKSHFERAVRRLAPIIEQLRAEGPRDIESLKFKLNRMGVAAPSRPRFSLDSVRRVLVRMNELGLGDGPQKKSDAMSKRRRAGDIMRIEQSR